MWQRVLPENEIISLASYRCIKSAGDVIAWNDFENLATDEVKKEYTFCSGNQSTCSLVFSSYLLLTQKLSKLENLFHRVFRASYSRFTSC